MPYLRIYSREVPIEQKRVITQKLIEITMRAFHLREEERNRITIQFIPQPPQRKGGAFWPVISRGSDCALEVIGHDLTEEKMCAFTEEAAAIIPYLLTMKPRGVIARVLGATSNTHRELAVQFNELSAAISDPFIVDQDRQAA
jgi:hypothetical protein